MAATLTYRDNDVQLNAASDLLIAIVVIAFALITAPVTIPLHVVLRAFGRRGFASIENGDHVWNVDSDAFARR